MLLLKTLIKINTHLYKLILIKFFTIQKKAMTGHFIEKYNRELIYL